MTASIIASFLGTTTAFAANPFAEGDPIVNPLTGETEIVTSLLADSAVVTNKSNVILVEDTTVGRIFTDPEDPDTKLQVKSRHTNDTSSLIDTITVVEVTVADDGTVTEVADSERQLGLVTAGTGPVPDDKKGDPGNDGGPVHIDIPAGNLHVYTDKRVGSQGYEGSDGWGLRVCIIWCFTIGQNAERGGNGGDGPTINEPPITGEKIESISDNLPGVWAASFGGNGGKGGDAYVTLNLDGAQGGTAGKGGNVTVTSQVDITTGGVRSHGMFVQSRAGAGGAGGDKFGFGDPGTGGPAAEAGDAMATNEGEIITNGTAANGMLVQSLGGGGGAGGDSYGLVGVGGSASEGGNAGKATATNKGSITTWGEAASGVVVQSIGGDGGDAGAAYQLAAAVGGKGNTGGDGDEAAVTNDGGASITTHGSYAFGILAQSIGGGGGNGGTAGGIGSVGGSGGGGGDGGLVTVTNKGTVHTTGEGAFGIVGQSIGGGGGAGGTGGGIVGIGGSGAGGGKGEAVAVTNTSGSSVTTTGVDAHAIVAQSIGGGGGTGGLGAGVVGIGGNSSQSTVILNNGGTVTVTNQTSSLITTGGSGANGILAQSIGGGGGSGAGGAGAVGLGGKGSRGGNGALVTVTNNATIQTRDTDAKGIVAQSIGGGGGSAHASGGIFSLGGAGSGGGNGGVVNVTNNGDITTGLKFGSNGGDAILAQSIGGGGGDGGSSGGLVALGGGGTAGGIGQAVTVTNNGSIVTDGARARGILAQSIGGGGGTGGDSGGLVSYGGNGSVASKGGEVTVTNTGIIETNGNQSSAIEAESIGGGGGNGGTSGGVFFTLGGAGGKGGAGETVTINNSYELVTHGNDSHGILAQSIGGGGGNGGNSASVSVFAGAAIGGGGGEGGAADEVTINSTNRVVNIGGVPTTLTPFIHTEGDRAKGIFAQSVGGGGGNGGFAAQVSVGYGVSASVAVGGSGAAGGDGNTVKLTGSTAILTEGVDADGVLAQSVGGGGGNGGFAVSFAGAAGDAAGVALGVGVGGSGGKGGKGGDVTLTAGGDITTKGLQSEGLIAQSIGGGGGNGGFSVTIAAAAAGGVSGSVAVGVGGSGGDGGEAGIVNATYAGDITTEGKEANAILVQGVGGAGGNGGFNVSGAVSAAGTASAGVAIGVGGSGGKGGDGGVVTANITGDVTTLSDRSNGFIAQSIGGRGGNGAFNISGQISASGGTSGGVSVGVGGAGGGAGHGKSVTATLTGDASTNGEDADAFLAQSVGGGGGNGGFNVTAGVTASGGNALGVSVGVGGSGGSGGNGSTVSATANGDLTTMKDRSNAFIAQSLGGGGGNGGLNVGVGITASQSANGAVSVGVGGSGGGGGNGSTVDATVNGDVHTYGKNAAAIIAQSLGGGGGNGGINVSGAVGASVQSGTAAVAVGVGGSGGTGGFSDRATLTVNGDVTTEADGAGGVLAQSVGGGGGNGALNVSGSVALSGGTTGAFSVGVGGSGGSGGKGGAAIANVTGDVTTFGDNAVAITSQSIGGGGGNGGINVGVSVSLSGSGAGNIGVGVGGSGGLASIGEAASATVIGNTTTHGDDSHGVFVQSVGGGGGNGGINVQAGLSAAKAGAGTLGVGVGGFGGGGGDAGSATATITGDSTTSGEHAYGVLIQSIGGGGGNGGLNVSGNVSLAKDTSGTASIGVGGFGGGAGSGSTVTGTVTGDVTTSGKKSIGVLAQSVGGAGGNGGLNVSGVVQISTQGAAAGAVGIGGFGGGGGDGKAVTLTRSGVTKTSAAESDGVVAQSIGGGGGNGGINISGAITGSTQGSAFTGTFGLGGFGGTGGIADAVLATVTGDVFATGLGSDKFVTEDGVTRRVRDGGSNGVLAQSVGGSGGNGGLNVSGGISLAKSSSQSNALNIGIGGFGGTGGNAGTVNLTVNADMVRAIGDKRFAVGAQSVGGSGGNGGINVSAGIVMDGQLTVGIGGFGGAGGTGSTVTLSSITDVIASGANSIGVMAQSVGGGGGYGGINVSGGIQADKSSSTPSLVFGLGGFGGAGNISDDVTATQRGSVLVDGVDSIGVLAQSVAGGGGNGGLNVSGNLAIGKGYSASVGVGGKGGKGADAGMVSLTSDGDIFVDGRELTDSTDPVTEEKREEISFRDRANGILAQSIGGGGGNGGMNIAGAVAPKGSPIAVGVGGTGGGGGHADTVTVNRGLNDKSTLITLGNNANGLTAQSIGGGGGNAGVNIAFDASLSGEKRKQVKVAVGGAGGDPGNGSTVTVKNVGNIATAGNRSDGILAQSVGGGGGSANVNLGTGVNRKTTGLDIVVGGGTGDGGSGGAVIVEHRGIIATAGNSASAIFAQSVGGGGGDAEAEDTQFVDFFSASEIALDVASDEETSVNIGIGRTGGTGGKGGTVSVTSNGDLATLGVRAVGIRAQSVGNSGGVSGTTSFDYSGKKDVTVRVGLEGGDGGSSEAVTVNSSGSIATSGSEAHAVHAQSVGGGGGVGGAATSKLVQGENNAFSLGLGGTGGKAGTSGVVIVGNSATLTTSGDGAHGIYAQSIGGGGGTGGVAGITASAAAEGAAELVKDAFKKKEKNDENKGKTSIKALVGGSGGIGASGNTVTVTNSGTIETKGRAAFGINAESIGGGGGDGGMVLSGSIAGGKTDKTIALNVGGTGGDTSVGKDVTVNNSGVIHTIGDQSIGIRAQSIGGSGGDAGLMANLGISSFKSEASSLSISFNMGADGGKAGAAGNVSVTNARGATKIAGDILTEGNEAHGIFAQSLGGGGGNGSSIVSAMLGGGKGSMMIGANVGGTGGNGGKGGDVSVTNGARIDTFGNGSHGIFAQSIGGGGGNGGIALATDAVFAKNTGDPKNALIALGGSGGTGENAGDVVVTNTGTIVTRGNQSNGILAQSIGGGGGNAGMSLGISSELGSTLVGGLMSTIFGGDGGTGGLGGHVTVNHSGDITVLGNNSRAIVAESINGGGGHVALDFNGISSLPGGSEISEGLEIKPVFVFGGGGNEVKNYNAGLVTQNVTGTFGVAGKNGAASSIQSIGGGGGTFDANLNILDSAATGGSSLAKRNAATHGDPIEIQGTLGGKNGLNNDGGAIASNHVGDLITEGANTHALFVQSIGGGGGRANLDVSGNGSLGATSLTIGGQGGSNENGASIAYTHSGVITTAGASAVGLLVQSIGGGGGEATLLGVSNANVVMGGSSGANGNGGAIALTNSGNISTSGARAHGAFVQSIGGGGGAVLSDHAAIDVVRSSQNSGNGGAIAFTQNGRIVTTGTEAYGLLAQSLGGGGGFADASFAASAGGAGAGGAVTLNLNGDLIAIGDRSNALFAQSGGTGGGNIRVYFAADRKLIAGLNGVAATLDGGADNLFENRGAVMSLFGPTGWALVGGSGSELIDNYGSIMGNADLGAGANRIVNRPGAAFYSASTLGLGGADNLFANDGLFAPGGRGLAVNTQLNGSFTQSANATAELEIDFASGVVDSLSATGTATLAGKVDLSMLNVHAMRPGNYTKALFTADGGVVDNGVRIDAQPSIVVSFDTLGASAGAIGYIVDFSPAGLIGNRVEIGDYINRVQTAGSSAALAPTITQLVAQTDLQRYSALLTQMSPEFYAEQQTYALTSAQRFAQTMQDCGSLNIERALGDQPGCVWAEFNLSASARDAESGFPEAAETARRYSNGVQRGTDSGWTFGVGIDIETNDSHGYGDQWKSDTSNFEFAVLGRREWGDTSIGGVIGIGNSRQKVQRQVSVTTPAVARGRRDVTYVSGVLNATHAIKIDRWALIPSFDIGVAALHGEAISEVGAGPQGLTIDSADQTHSWFEPGVTVAFENALTAQASLRTYARIAALRYFHGMNAEVHAGLVGAPAGVAPMNVTSELDRNRFLGEFGIELLNFDRWSIGLNYAAERSGIRSDNSGTARITVPVK